MLEKTEIQLQDEKYNEERAKEYDQKVVEEKLKGIEADKIQAAQNTQTETKFMDLPAEVRELQVGEDDEVPDLEEVDQQQRELEELQKSKEQKH